MGSCDVPGRRGGPEEPPPSEWVLPEPVLADGDLVALGGELEPGLILDAYRRGMFPMRVQRGGPLGWWSPDPRGVIPLDALRVTPSLRRSLRRFEVRVDTAFDAVIEACADPDRPAGWIDESFVEAYTRLHELGWAHSVEAWSTRPGRAPELPGRAPELVGGLYGVAVGGLFAGESMFHRSRDASKVALVGLVDRLLAGGGVLLDVQWLTPHLATLGAAEVPRHRYLDLLADARTRPQLRLS